jgi:hypothetical protein
MDQGVIKDIGTHRELLDKSVYYRRLYDMQFNRLGETLPAPEQPYLVEAVG